MKKKLIMFGVICSCLLSPMSLYADVDSSIDANTYVADNAGTARITVSKYIEIERDYADLAFVPMYYPYSYYDHDYSTTLKGSLQLVNTIKLPGYVRAVFAGYCSGSI